MRLLALLVLAAAVAGCAAHSPFQKKIDPGIAAELNKAANDPRKEPVESDIRDALLPPLKLEMPGAAGRPIEPRFDLSVNEAPAAQVFMSIVSGTRYSMLVHSDVKGAITVNLKDVTVQEALDALRDLYGYEYRFDGTRILIQATGMRSRVFRVNYLIGQRLGRSDIRVTSGSIADSAGTSGAGIPGVPGTTGLPTAPTQTGATPATASGMSDSSRIQTSVRNDFWEDLRQTLTQIIGKEGGRNVVVNPQAGLVVVRAMAEELRQVESYLRAIRLSVERQVMLEAKIVEVTLSEEYQTGVNWALFSRGMRGAAGLINPNTALATSGANVTGNLSVNPLQGSTASVQAGSTAPSLIPGLPGGSLFGLAFQTANFSALLSFLESQGSVQVLSSPRIATINNQQAVLKVGTDQFFITNIAGGSGATGSSTLGGTTSFPTLTMRPFFSGVALDITPQIDEDSSVVLHIHPSVSNVQQDDKVVNLGTVFGGQITLPLARSTVSETDSIVRVRNNNIVAIGGLMKLDTADGRSGLPGLQDSPAVGGLFGSKQRTAVKKELVILIRPTVVQSDRDWETDLGETRERILNMGGGSPVEPGAAPARR